ncbi:cation transporter ChaC [Rhizoctonia solani]|uniref:glutathione-specific gamma-glutamylcyclotransferase n=1 Tax=Rhizoctonia solani TaxID=456999 RepID=A0A8H8NTC2_9AGAM|nr:cation transporter ChaC [Rhizoctonia solani]QRW19666.1 cation transporter ChaC [Rhizoctonia solani]
MIVREKNGYTVQHLDVWGIVDGVEKIIVPNATCYVGRSDNPAFVGSEPVPILAKKIWESSGPSGPNKEYLYELARAVRELAPESHDSHLSALEAYVRRLDEQSDE